MHPAILSVNFTRHLLSHGAMTKAMILRKCIHSTKYIDSVIEQSAENLKIYDTGFVLWTTKKLAHISLHRVYDSTGLWMKTKNIKLFSEQLLQYRTWIQEWHSCQWYIARGKGGERNWGGGRREKLSGAGNYTNWWCKYQKELVCMIFRRIEDYILSGIRT